MSTTTTPPTVPPGWQRRQELIAALPAIQEEVDEVRLVLPAVNDGILRPRVEDLLAVATELVAVHGCEPGDDVAEALAGLQVRRVCFMCRSVIRSSTSQRRRCGHCVPRRAGCARRWTMRWMPCAPPGCCRWKSPSNANRRQHCLSKRC